MSKSKQELRAECERLVNEHRDLLSQLPHPFDNLRTMHSWAAACIKYGGHDTLTKLLWTLRDTVNVQKRRRA